MIAARAFTSDVIRIAETSSARRYAIATRQLVYYTARIAFVVSKTKKMVLPWLASLSCLLVLLSSARSSVSLEGRRSQEEFNWSLHMPRLKNAAKVSDKRVVILFTRVVCVCLCPVIIDTVRYSI